MRRKVCKYFSDTYGMRYFYICLIMLILLFINVSYLNVNSNTDKISMLT